MTGINTEQIKKIAGAVSVIFVFILSLLIIYNTLRINEGTDLAIPDQTLKHFVQDHNVNNNTFQFITINNIRINFYETGEATGMTIVAATGLFLIPAFIILFFLPGIKFYFRVRFLFGTGFKNSLFKPPRLTS